MSSNTVDHLRQNLRNQLFKDHQGLPPLNRTTPHIREHLQAKLFRINRGAFPALMFWAFFGQTRASLRVLLRNYSLGWEIKSTCLETDPSLCNLCHRDLTVLVCCSQEHPHAAAPIPFPITAHTEVKATAAVSDLKPPKPAPRQYTRTLWLITGAQHKGHSCEGLLQLSCLFFCFFTFRGYWCICYDTKAVFFYSSWRVNLVGCYLPC